MLLLSICPALGESFVGICGLHDAIVTGVQEFRSTQRARAREDLEETRRSADLAVSEKFRSSGNSGVEFAFIGIASFIAWK